MVKFLYIIHPDSLNAFKGLLAKSFQLSLDCAFLFLESDNIDSYIKDAEINDSYIYTQTLSKGHISYNSAFRGMTCKLVTLDGTDETMSFEEFLQYPAPDLWQCIFGSCKNWELGSSFITTMLHKNHQIDNIVCLFPDPRECECDQDILDFHDNLEFDILGNQKFISFRRISLPEWYVSVNELRNAPPSLIQNILKQYVNLIHFNETLVTDPNTLFKLRAEKIRRLWSVCGKDIRNPNKMDYQDVQNEIKVLQDIAVEKGIFHLGNDIGLGPLQEWKALGILLWESYQLSSIHDDDDHLDQYYRYGNTAELKSLLAEETI